ncbi:MAG: hypothetical protein ACYC6K_04100 [Bellilinea sp.]
MPHADIRISRGLKPISLYLKNLYQIEAMLQPGLSDRLGGFSYYNNGDLYKAKSVDELLSDFRIAGQEDFNYLGISIFGLYITLTAYESEVWISLDRPHLREKMIEVIEYLTPLQIENNEGGDNIHLYQRGSIKDIERLEAIEKSSVIENKKRKAEFEKLRNYKNQSGTLTNEPDVTLIPEKTKISIPKFLSSGVFWAILGVLATIIIGILQMQR